jgi:hypothetical protein
MPPKKKAMKPAPKKPALPKQEPLDKRFRRNTSGLQPSTSVTYSAFNRSRRPYDYILSQLSARPDLHPLRAQAPMGPPTWAMQGVYDPFDPLAGVRALTLDDRRALNKDASMEQADTYVPPEDAEMEAERVPRKQFGPLAEPTLDQLIASQAPGQSEQGEEPDEPADTIQAMADGYARADDPQYNPVIDRLAFLEDQFAQQMQQQVTMQQLFEQQQRTQQLREQEYMNRMFVAPNTSGNEPEEPEEEPAEEAPQQAVLEEALQTIGGPSRIPHVSVRATRRPMTIAPERVNVLLRADTPWMSADGAGTSEAAPEDAEDEAGPQFEGNRRRKAARVRKGKEVTGNGKKHVVYRADRLGGRKKQVL